MEGGASFNSINFNIYEYNDAHGHQFDRFLSGGGFVHLSRRRPAARTAAAMAPIRTTAVFRPCSAATVTTTTARRSTPISTRSVRRDCRAQPSVTPYRNKASRVNGLLHQGKTRIAEITDGTSNTIAIGEDAGRDPRFLSPYTQDVYGGIAPNGVLYATTTAYLAAVNPNDPGGRWRRRHSFGVTGGGLSLTCASAFPAHRTTSIVQSTSSPAWMTGGPFVAQGNNAGKNDELASFHPGGVNVLMGDGSVRFLKDSVNVVTLRGLVTPPGW